LTLPRHLFPENMTNLMRPLSGNPMPNNQTPQLDDALHAKRQSFDKIPVVDLAPLLDGSDPHKVAGEINWALANAGFMKAARSAL